MDRRPNSFGPVLGYHGCDREVAEQVLSGQSDLRLSENSYDWLGSGIYFWVDSPQRALDWALEAWRGRRIEEPYIVGAHINLGLCLNFIHITSPSELIRRFHVQELPQGRRSLTIFKNLYKDRTFSPGELVQ